VLEHPQQEEQAVTSLQTRSAAFEDLPQSPRVVATSLNTVRLDIVL
jgi:hypothetical protein